MRAAEREDRVLSLLRTRGRASVEDLASEVGVTTSTIRRDLQRLSDGGRVVRTYGGAAIPGPRLADIIAPVTNIIAH